MGLRKSYIITNDSGFSKTYEGNIVIKEQVTFHLRGTIIGRMTIQRGAKVYVFGSLCGDVVNEGGELHIKGIFTGNIHGRGHNFCHPGSVVNGSVASLTGR